MKKIKRKTELNIKFTLNGLQFFLFTMVKQGIYLRHMLLSGLFVLLSEQFFNAKLNFLDKSFSGVQEITYRVFVASNINHCKDSLNLKCVSIKFIEHYP